MSTHSQPAGVPTWHGTTILTVRKEGRVVIAGDGQVSLGQTVIKANAKKVRRLGRGDVIGGFAGATADAFTLFERLEAKIELYPGNSHGPPWNWPRIGARTATCAASKP